MKRYEYRNIVQSVTQKTYVLDLPEDIMKFSENIGNVYYEILAERSLDYQTKTLVMFSVGYYYHIDKIKRIIDLIEMNMSDNPRNAEYIIGTIYEGIRMTNFPEKIWYLNTHSRYAMQKRAKISEQEIIKDLMGIASNRKLHFLREYLETLF
jgi:hypothetical protein